MTHIVSVLGGASLRAGWILCSAGALGLFVACDLEERPGPNTLEVVVDTVGDTTIVHTVAGRQWEGAELVLEMSIGELDGAEYEMFGNVFGLAVHPSGTVYVYDSSVPALRRYASDGTYLNMIGQQGGGPGEYQNSDGGLAVLRDGRVVLRDPGNGRFTVYSPEGEYLATWTSAGGALTSVPLVGAPDGGFFHHIPDPGAVTPRVVHFSSDGRPIVTLTVPLRDIAPPMLMARGPGGGIAGREVPFSPRGIWSIHSSGGFLTAVTDRYEIDRHGPDGSVLRISRAIDPVPVSTAERESERERATRAMRSIDPTWQWDAPPVPSRKPFFQRVYSGTDGRLWVVLHQPGELVPESQGEDVADQPPRFDEPVVFDVFEENGRYLGEVHTPKGFALFPPPIFGTDAVWAVVRGDLDVPRIVRLRLEIQE